MLGNCATTSTSRSESSVIRSAASARIKSQATGFTYAPPKSATTPTFSPRSSSRYVPRPASNPSTRGSARGVRRSGPFVTSSQRALSRTLRETQPGTAVRFPISALGPFGIRPYVTLRPTSPQNPAGIRIDPPPSPAVAAVRMPPATADDEPPEEPPGVRSVFQGLRVAPLSTVRVRFTPPNSDDVVRPTAIAPASTSRATIVDVWVAT